MHDHVPSFLLVAIIIAYFVIAWQFRGLWKKTESKKAKAKFGLALLIAVFVLCSLSGYLPRVVSIPILLQDASHVILAVASWWFILTRQAARIAEALE